MANEKDPEPVIEARWFWATRALNEGVDPEWVRRNILDLPGPEGALNGWLLANTDAFRVGYSPKANVFMDRAVGRLLAPVCEHPAALLVLADALATCDGCGRVFELRDFGK